MFIGHFGVAFAAKRAAPKTPLWVLMGAALWADLICPIFMLAGWEQVEIGGSGYMPVQFNFPFSHGGAELVIWAALLAGIYFGGSRDRRGSIVIGLCVLSHWILDWITHRSDMVFYSGGVGYGLALWNHPVLCFLIEGGVFAAGVWLYTRTTESKDRWGRYALTSLVVFLSLSYVISFFAPAPSNATAIAVFNLSVWIFPVWAAWIDRHRAVKLIIQMEDAVS